MRHPLLLTILCVFLLNGLWSCQNTQPTESQPVEAPSWAIAIHAGAGAMDRDSSPEAIEAAREALRRAVRLGSGMLEQGSTGLDTVEAVIQVLEDYPRFNAGRGAVFTADGRHELDASIMDGSNLACGAVAGVRTVKNPIRLARRVMEGTRHVLLAGDGAEAFADTQADIVRVAPDYFSTEERRESLERWKQRQASASDIEVENEWKSTVGCVVLDQYGHLAAGTSTGGMTGKRFGRVGDSPIIGAGTFADDRTCAVSSTGTGEEYIRHSVARDISDRMRYLGFDAQTAAQQVIHEVLQPDDGGVIVVGSDGSIALVFNTEGMFRGAADSTGFFGVGIWEEFGE